MKVGFFFVSRFSLLKVGLFVLPTEENFSLIKTLTLQ